MTQMDESAAHWEPALEYLKTLEADYVEPILRGPDTTWAMLPSGESYAKEVKYALAVRGFVEEVRLRVDLICMGRKKRESLIVGLPSDRDRLLGRRAPNPPAEKGEGGRRRTMREVAGGNLLRSRDGGDLYFWSGAVGVAEYLRALPEGMVRAGDLEWQAQVGEAGVASLYPTSLPEHDPARNFTYADACAWVRTVLGRLEENREEHPLPLRRAWEAVEWGVKWQGNMQRPLPVFSTGGGQ